MHRSRDRSRSGGDGAAFVAQATAYLDGFAPTHYWDFQKNKAIIGGTYVGSVTNSPGWSVTGGDLVMDSTGLEVTTQKVIATPTITYPCTLYAEYQRGTDSGGAETLVQLFAAGTDRVGLQVTASDVGGFFVRVGGVVVASQNPALAITPGVNKIAARLQATDLGCAANGISDVPINAAVPTTPVQIQFGSLNGTGSYLGAGNRLLKVAVLVSLLSDAELDALTTP